MAKGTSVLKSGVASLADCARLWTTLTKDYIPGLKVELSVRYDDRDEPAFLVELVDYSHVGGEFGMERSVWSKREFFSPLYLISHTQLFDLLIVGFRNIEEFFTTGRDNRPSSLKG